MHPSDRRLPGALRVHVMHSKHHFQLLSHHKGVESEPAGVSPRGGGINQARGVSNLRQRPACPVL